MTSPHFPEPPASIPATPIATIDALLQKLDANKHVWAKKSLAERIQVLEALQPRLKNVAPRWVEAGCRAKGLDVNSSLAGEEWLGGPMTTVRNVRLLIEALKQKGQPKYPNLSQRRDGQWVADVFPANALDKVMWAGFSAQVWMEPGKEPTQGAIYRKGSTTGKVSLVLGAGNVASIGPMDALYKLFVENEVVILKMNPVNEYLGPFVEEAFKPLVDAGFLAVVYGGAEVGKHLTRHSLVESIHITGSDRTHDAIVWGDTLEEQQANKAAKTPVNTRPITSELGCVTPVFVVPGDWNEAELNFQARHVSSMVAHNGSFNCNAAKIVVTAKGWPLRDLFLRKLHDELKAIGPRKSYYPGARQRYQNFLDRYPNAIKLQSDGEQHVPWTVLPDVPLQKGEYALSQEAFCGVLAEVTIDASDAATFMQKALDAANDVFWGTLSCMVLVHPSTEKQFAKEFDHFIANLKYGGIGINVWAGAIYGLVVTTWGAHPGHTLDNIVSGRGVVHNTYLFDHPQKSVMRAPFVIKPTPAWFAQHKNLRNLGEKLVAFESAPSFFALPGVVLEAMKG